MLILANFRWKQLGKMSLQIDAACDGLQTSTD